MVKIKYKRIPEFCYFCGLIKQKVNEYVGQFDAMAVGFDIEAIKEENKFDQSLKIDALGRTISSNMTNAPTLIYKWCSEIEVCSHQEP